MEQRPRVVVIDDAPVVAMGLAHPDQEVEVVASFSSVEEFLAGACPPVDVIILDLMLDGPAPGGSRGVSGTHAIKLVLGANRGPVVVYTGIVEEMLLAACMAAGATGIVTKKAPPRTIGEVVRAAAKGMTWVDPLVAGAFRRMAEGRHAGALSPQQAQALRLRGKGLTQKAIAAKLNVADPEIAAKYLRAAVEKLIEPGAIEDPEETGRGAGAVIDDLAKQTGLGEDLVRYEDVQPPKRRRPSRR